MGLKYQVFRSKLPPMRVVHRLLLAAALLVAGVGGLSSCKKPADSIKKELREAGYQATTEDWLRASREDNEVALKKFVAGGFAVDARDAAGDSALHVAARAGAEKAANYLLSRGLAIDLRGAAERTPLMAAVLANNPRMVRWLLRQGAAARLKDRDGYTPLMLAVRENSSKVVGELAIYTREDLDAALLAAALEGRAEMIDVLTKYGASVYARMDDGRTPLMLAAQGGHAEAVKLLMELGSGRFTATADGTTAADFARTEGHQELADLILSQPATAELTLETPAELATAMDAYVEAAAAEIPDAAPDDPAVGDEIPGSPAIGRPRAPRGTPVPLAGQTLAAAPAAATEAASGPGNPSAASGAPPGSAAGRGPAARLPLVMRHYREREIPLQVVTVSADSATLRIAGPAPREVRVRAGETVPGSSLVVVHVHRRMNTGKGNDGNPTEVSVVELRDTGTGASRELIAGVPATAHDPVALVEDATTGQRYTATPGQRFRGGDGEEYVVNDVSSNQIVIEHPATGSVQTLPLRGPRG
jgi:ankyrin repeat protein